MLSIPFTEILYGTRLRTEYPEIDELAASIHENGIIHPMTLAVEDAEDGSVKRYELIAGGRRYNAYKKLRELHPGLYDTVPVTLRKVTNKSDLRLLELEENFRREDMTWQESTLGIREYHMLSSRTASARGDRWTQTMTGKLCGVSQAQISSVLTVASKLKENDKEIWNCENLSGAVKLLLERGVKEAQIERMRRIDAERKSQADKLKAASPIAPSTNAAEKPVRSSVLKDAVTYAEGIIPDEPEFTECAVDLDQLEKDLEEAKARSMKQEESTSIYTQDYIRSLYFAGDCIDSMKMMKEKGIKIDHIITDPPYGIDMANLEMMDNIDSVEDTHNVAQNVAQFEPFLRAAFDLLPDHGFLAMWYDLDHHEKLIELGKAIGFKVQRWPIVWCKTTPCLNTMARYNWTKSTEVCMVMRKSASSILSVKQSNNFILEPNTKDARHPFAKPFAVWERLIHALTLEGQTILDPFAGSGSALYAAIKTNRLALGCEVSDLHISEAIEHLSNKLNLDFKSEASSKAIWGID
jgi:site-specific DNA-methyltransferase (adenine-specific)